MSLDAAIVLAGGGGKRLWPWTGPQLPKPALPLGGDGRSLLVATLNRVAPLLESDGSLRILAAKELGEQLSHITAVPRERFDEEPSPRDTAPAIALAMRRIQRHTPQAVVAILPADHRIVDEAAFRAALDQAAALARAQGRLVTLGISPTRPASSMGYIVRGPKLDDSASEIDRFVEKPQPADAAALIASGALWNAGVFVFRADTFWDELQTHAPQVAEPVARFVDPGGGDADWIQAEKTSIDYALMERTKRSAVIPLDAGWADLGTWESVLELVEAGDAGDAIRVRSRGPGPGTVVLDVSGGDASPESAVVIDDHPCLVVLGPHGVLVAKRSRSSEVKTFI